jgi:carbonic anhydrase
MDKVNDSHQSPDLRMEADPSSYAPPNSATPSASLRDKPQNGIAGLKHWPYDLRSGFMVAMVSLPFSMGIAITSGAPPVCGVISAIVAGFLLPFLGGSFVTISGPAAGLAPVLFSGMIMLATAEIGKAAAAEKTTHELLEIGYPMVLVAIAVAGVLQVILARLKVARLSAIFPASAIEGMLAAIGMLIMVKQLPLFCGTPFKSHEFWGMLEEIPYHLSNFYHPALITGVGCTAALFVLDALPYRLLKVMPPPVWVFILGSLLFQSIFHIPSGIPTDDALKADPTLPPLGYCIYIPEDPIGAVQLPQFDRITNHPQTWTALAYVVFVLLLIDATESLATIVAVDKLDPFKRRSDPDATLQAMGSCNLASSIVGGLTIIPGIVKSTANIIGGGRTLWANFFNACMLLIFMFLARPLINQVPLAVIAAILMFIGWKLCGHKVWKHTMSIGVEQFSVFLITLIVTVSTDLLIGIGVGVLVKLMMDMSLIGLANRINGFPPKGSMLARFKDLFRDPVGRRESNGDVYEVYVEGPLHCFNLLHTIRMLQQPPNGTKTLRLHFTTMANLVDHTSVETVFHYLEDYRLKGVNVELVGWKRFLPLSDHETAVRFGLPMKLADQESELVGGKGVP